LNSSPTAENEDTGLLGLLGVVERCPSKRWQAALLSLIAALALPVVGLITGRVVGDFFLEVFAPRSSRGDLIGAVGAGFGVLVYALALASSYSHLRHYYRGYEAQGVRASWALALAVEVATFYMSFAYVVIHSPWAFWGSLIGAFVVFWANFSSMYEARIERAGDIDLCGETTTQPARTSVVTASPVGEHLEAAQLHGAFPEQTLGMRFLRRAQRGVCSRIQIDSPLMFFVERVSF